MAAPRKLLDKLVKKDKKKKDKPKADPNKVPLGTGGAGRAKKALQNRNDKIDEIIRQNGG